MSDLRKAAEQWKTCRHCGFDCKPPKADKWFPLEQREWVGLTDEDLTQFTDEFYKGAVWAEAKLKDRNA
jgi:hypothetical protein